MMSVINRAREKGATVTFTLALTLRHTSWGLRGCGIGNFKLQRTRSPTIARHVGSNQNSPNKPAPGPLHDQRAVRCKQTPTGSSILHPEPQVSIKSRIESQKPPVFRFEGTVPMGYKTTALDSASVSLEGMQSPASPVHGSPVGEP